MTPDTLDIKNHPSIIAALATALANYEQEKREIGEWTRILDGVDSERPEFPFGEFDNGNHWRGE